MRRSPLRSKIFSGREKIFFEEWGIEHGANDAPLVPLVIFDDETSRADAFNRDVARSSFYMNWTFLV
jgi:hypothetical protein